MLVALKEHDSGANNAFRIDARVGVEILVLGGDKRFLTRAGMAAPGR